MSVSIIVAISKNFTIGNDNGIPWHLPADLSFFKKMTLNKTVIMGRRTYESLGKPLPNRHNIVITRDKNLLINGVSVVNSLDAAIESVNTNDDVFIIGGGNIYRQAIDIVDTMYITEVDVEIDGDTKFPSFDMSQWGGSIIQIINADEKNHYDMVFKCFRRL